MALPFFPFSFFLFPLPFSLSPSPLLPSPHPLLSVCPTSFHHSFLMQVWLFKVTKVILYGSPSSSVTRYPLPRISIIFGQNIPSSPYFHHLRSKHVFFPEMPSLLEETCTMYACANRIHHLAMPHIHVLIVTTIIGI